MNHKGTMIAGMILIILGAMFLASNLAGTFLGITLPHFGFLSLGPTFVLSIGVFLVLIPVLFSSQKWTGVFFIPAMPILAVGGILMVGAMTGYWGIWGWAWSLLPLAIAAGFILAAVFSRNGWLAIPAFPIGITGLILYFCAITGWWSAWSWLWTAEVIGIGLMIIYIGVLAKSQPVIIVGSCIGGLGLALATMMLTILSYASGIGSILASGLLIVVGAAVLIFSLLPRRADPVATPPAV